VHLVNEVSKEEFGINKSRAKQKLTVQALACNRENIGREQYSHDPTIPENANKLERLAQLSQVPSRLREVVWGEEESPKADQAVCSCRGDTCRGDQGSESDARW